MSEETPLKLLERDHRKVEELFDDYKNADEEDKEDLTEKICKELEIHAELEEQLIYPVIKNSSGDGNSMIEDSIDEHQEMKTIISKLKMGEEFNVDDEMMQQLENVVKKHVDEEEGKVFPYADVNLKDELGIGLSAKMLAMKEKLRFQK